jgi:hypothetical protein
MMINTKRFYYLSFDIAVCFKSLSCGTSIEMKADFTNGCCLFLYVRRLTSIRCEVTLRINSSHFLYMNNFPVYTSLSHQRINVSNCKAIYIIQNDLHYLNLGAHFHYISILCNTRFYNKALFYNPCKAY